MKLIDLLVKELPSRGGFIKGANEAVQDYDGNVKFFDSANLHFDRDYDCGRWCGAARARFYCSDNNNFITTVADDYNSAIVTCEQYEAALKPVWNGEGLPPVGAEFEYGSHRSVAKCIAVSYHHVFASKGDPDDENGEYEEFLIDIGHSSFRPIRTEAERKRDLFLSEMFNFAKQRPTDSIAEMMEQLYDDIAAHKITGVTLVPTVSQIVRVTEKCSREDAERIVTMLTGGTITE